jgi:hypothetical protein
LGRYSSKSCPLKTKCIGKSHEKRINITAYRKEYNRNIERVNSRGGRCMKDKRQSTVKPVFGTLKEFMGLRGIGIRQVINVCSWLL